MTLRLSETQTAALRAQAEREGRSMQEVALQAVDDYVRTHARRTMIDRVLESELDTYADALRRLGE